MITAFLRTIILYLIITVGLRVMGKRQIGELEPGELVLTMMISDLATVPMQDFGIPLTSGLIPILTLMALSMLLSQASLHSLRFRSLLCGEPAILIRDGKLCQETMRRNRYTLDELLEQLRGQGITELNTVRHAVLENSGQLSVLLWAKDQPPTASQLQKKVPEAGALPRILINDGRVLRKNLKACRKDDAWLRKQLHDRGLRDPAEVFLLTLAGKDTIVCLTRDENA